jgi:hypothetical protein
MEPKLKDGKDQSLHTAVNPMVYARVNSRLVQRIWPIQQAPTLRMEPTG